jgi:Kelch motif
VLLLNAAERIGLDFILPIADRKDVAAIRADAIERCAAAAFRIASRITRFGLTAVAGPDGLIYVMGGRYSFHDPILKTVEAYDPRTNTWRR